LFSLETITLTYLLPERVELDKSVANRFIKNAIASATSHNAQTYVPAVPEQSTFVQQKVTDKMKEREEYLKAVKEADERESEEEGLEFMDDEEGKRNDMDLDKTPKNQRQKGKAKALPEDTEMSPPPDMATTRRQRPRAVDHFAGKPSLLLVICFRAPTPPLPPFSLPIPAAHIPFHILSTDIMLLGYDDTPADAAAASPLSAQTAGADEETGLEKPKKKKRKVDVGAAEESLAPATSLRSGDDKTKKKKKKRKS
jgi:hypothetical protein